MAPEGGGSALGPTVVWVSCMKAVGILIFVLCIWQMMIVKEGGDALEQAAQRGCGCSIPGGAQDQAGHGPKQPGLVPDLEVGGSAHGKVVGT